jgi:hypothetical protein
MRLAIALLAILTACGCTQQHKDDDAGDPAIWYLAKSQTLSQSSTAFTALVSPYNCNNGEAGDVLPPDVRMDEHEVIVTFQVATLKRGNAFCQGNAARKYRVKLAEPLGERALVDGECREHDGASSTSFCLPTDVRYEP